MMKPRLALLITLAACGKVESLPPDAAGSGPPDAFVVHVTSDQYSTDPAGQPIANATVLVDHGGANLERLATDATGTVQFARAGVVAFHVIFKGDTGFRLYTVAPPLTGTIELGGRMLSSSHSMTLTAPDNGSGDFTVRIPEACGFPSNFAAPSMLFSYDSSCEGKKVDAIVLSRGATGAMHDVFLDAGLIQLTNHATVPVTGNYVSTQNYTMQVVNLPERTAFVSEDILARTNLDLTSLEPTTTGVQTQNGMVTLTGTAAPGADTLRLEATADLPIQYTSTSTWITPAVFSIPSMTVDASGLPPLFSALTLTAPPSISWTNSAPGGSALVIEANAGPVLWDAYLDPTATSLAFPSLPADLAVPVPTAFDFVTVNRFDIPDTTPVQLYQTFDRLWNTWPNDPSLLPAKGTATSRIFYTAALGAP